MWVVTYPRDDLSRPKTQSQTERPWTRQSRVFGRPLGSPKSHPFDYSMSRVTSEGPGHSGSLVYNLSFPGTLVGPEDTRVLCIRSVYGVFTVPDKSRGENHLPLLLLVSLRSWSDSSGSYRCLLLPSVGFGLGVVYPRVVYDGGGCLHKKV